MAFSIGRGTLLGTGYISVTADTGDAEAKMGLLGKGLAGAAVGFTALAAAAAGTVAMASKFNSEMLKVQTQAGASSADVKTLSADILNMKNVQQGPTQLAEAMYHLKSIGLDNVNAMKDLKVASDLASVGGSNLEDTTNALGGAWRSGIKGAETFAMAAGTVNAVIGAGNMRMSDFVSAIGTGILPAAKTFGVSLSQVGAGLALMTDEGVPAVDAATRLKMSFSLLAAPSNAAAAQLAKIGLTGLEMANTMRGPTGLVGTIQLLKDHLDASGLSLSQQAILLSHAFGGGRSSSAILTMVNNVGVLKGKLDQINSSAAKLPDAIAAQRATLSAQMKIFEVQMQDTGIKVGEHLIGPVVQFMTFVNSTMLPGIGKVTGALAGMVPVDKIKADLASLTGGVMDFYHALNPSTPKAKAGSAQKAFAATVGAVTYPSAPRLFDGGGPAGPLAPAGTVLGPVAPGRVAPVRRAPDPFVWQSGGQPLSMPSGLASPYVGTGAPNLSSWTTGAGAVKKSAVGPLAPVGGVKLPAPDVSGWTKAGSVIHGVITDLGKVVGPVATAFLGLKSVASQTLPLVLPAIATLATDVGSLLMPALSIVGTFLVKTFVPTMHNLGTIATQLLPVLQPLAVVVGVVLFAALSAVGFILNKVVGPALVAVTGFLAHNKDATYALVGFLALLNAQFVISKVNMAANAVAMGIYNGWNFILGVQMKANAVWTGAVTAAQWLWNTSLVTSAVTMAGNVAGWVAWQAEMAADSVWQGIVTAKQWLWNAAAIATDASTWAMVAGWIALKAQMIAGAAWTGIVTAAQWAWNLAMDANPIALVVIAIAALVAGIVWVAMKTTWFETAWRYTWNFVKTVSMDVFNFLTHGLGQLVLLLLGPIGVLLILANNWKTVWNFLKTSASATWDFLDKWVIHPIAVAFNWLNTSINAALRFIIMGFLNMVGTILHGAKDMLGWMPGIGPQLKTAVKAFDAFRDGVNAALGGVKPKVVPVTVSFNGVPQGQITGNTFTSTTGFSYAQGGLVHGPGTGTSDSILAAGPGGLIRVSDKEFIVNAKSTAKHLKLLQAINSGNPKEYARGGMVDFTHAAASDMGLAGRMDIAAEVKQMAGAYAHAYNTSQGPRGLAWARTQVGMPYQWGGDGNPSWDCSGFMSAIESVMRGESPHRRWATGAFNGATAPPGWVENGQSPFMIGITNAGVGHTAGTLMGVNVEMSTVGGRVGGSARGANDPMFPSHYGLATFDRGGWLMPGKTLATNNTGRPERVVGPHESTGNTYVFNFTGPVGSQAELENWTVKTLTTLKQRGRLRGLVGS